ncbi:tetratricopeptide repeat protein [Legionella sp. WA2024007413]
MYQFLLLLCLPLLSYSNLSFAEAPLSKPLAPVFDNLGSFHFNVSTNNKSAQKFFNQGMVLFYGFEWGESARSFKEAMRLDPQCGMCYWGFALATGSKINAPMTGHEYQDAKQAIEKAVSLKQYMTPQENAYILALMERFKHQPRPQETESSGTFSCHRSSTNFDKSSSTEMAAYAEAMEKIIAHYPTDHNAKALYAYALFEVIEWKFWGIDGKENPKTVLIVNALKNILANEPEHIGANHYFIHAIESSKEPQKAMDSANRLTTLVPGSEHLVHMPAHIYFLTGKYAQGSESNLKAIDAFNTYNTTCRQQGFAPEINYLYMHNYDFLRTTATMEGRQKLALWAARKMLAPPFNDWLKNEASLQWFIPIPYFVQARFALWDDLLKEPKPSKEYQYALGMWHYAQGMALSHTHQIKQAQQELTELKAIIEQGPSKKNLEKNGVSLLKIAAAVLTARLEAIQGNKEESINQLKIASAIQHDMGYHEPPDWYVPIKELLGDVYLRWNRPLEAIKMYEADLKQYPNNGWALWGLSNSLKKMGRTKDAEQVEKKFHEAWSAADVKTPPNLF